MDVKTLLLLLLACGIQPISAQEVASKSASNIEEYCFYSIYECLTGYTYESSSTSSSAASSSATSSPGSTSHGSSGSSQSSSGSTWSGKRSKHSRRGHKGSTSTTQCSSTVEVMSLYASAKMWCNKEQFAVVVPYWESLCEQSSLTLMNLTDIVANATDEYIATFPVIAPDVNTTTSMGTITSPVLLSESYYQRAYKSYVTHDYALDKDKRYGWGLLGYWVGILVLGMIHKLWNSCFINRYSSNSKSPSTSWSKSSKIGQFIRKHIIIPGALYPLLSHHSRLLYGHSIPRRLDLLIVSGFWALAIILSCINYESFSGNISTPDLFQQNWQYSSDRTGVLSYACLPFLWLFSARNNIFLWATEFNVQSFITFHRHIAWVATVLAVVHSINYTVIFVVYDGRYDSALLQKYFYMGIVATIAMCLLLAFSVTWFRRHWYQTFLIIHIVLALLTIYALFCHTSYDRMLYNGYLWPLVAIWSFERLIRYIRIVYCNLNVKLGKNFIAVTSSTVSYDEECDLLVVSLEPAQKSFSPRPGQYHYLYQPFTLRGWENHPFTLGGYTTSTRKALTESPASRHIDPQTEGKTELRTRSELAAEENKLVFYIRPYDGWTRRLRDHCLKATDTVIHPKILLEGPYGHTSPLHIYDHVLFILGGTGVSAGIPYILDYAARLKAQKTKTTHMHLVWTVRHRKMVEIIMSSILADARHVEGVKFTFYCTSSRSTITQESVEHASMSSIPSEETSIQYDKVANTMPAVNSPDQMTCFGAVSPPMTDEIPASLIEGRPNISQIVQDAAREAKTSAASLAVLSCGPPQMADDCRLSVYSVLTNGFPYIEYFEESFTW